MKNSIARIFFVVAGALLCLAMAQPAASGDGEVSGKVIETLREESIILVSPGGENDEENNDPVLIKGFPYNYAERELEIELGAQQDSIAIENGDCITVKYIEDEKKNYIILKAAALTRYCGDCTRSDQCYDTLNGIIFLQEVDVKYLPVNKNPSFSDSKNN